MGSQRTGITTGTCAAAAAKAATLALCGLPIPGAVSVKLPDGSEIEVPLAQSRRGVASATASVKKDAGDDPDVTDGCFVTATVAFISTGDIVIRAGEGVGTVTKPGLAIPPGEPAINPVPRSMIRKAIREVTDRAVEVTISIPGGQEIAEKTFNPRLGVVGGLSILGTSGIVRPFSGEALRDALRCTLNVASACKVTRPIFVPGRIGVNAAKRLFDPAAEQLVEVSNEWGFMLDEASGMDFEALLVLGHPGKLGKLAMDQWDTHSSRSRAAVDLVSTLTRELLHEEPPESKTVEGLLMELPEDKRITVSEALAGQIRSAVSQRISERFPIAVVLVNLSGEVLGTAGDIGPWQRADSPSV